MMKLTGYRLRRAPMVALSGGMLVALAMPLVAHSDQSVVQTTLEPGNNFIAAGDHFSLAVTCDGRVYAWGGNQNGQLGVDSEKNQQAPVQVHGVNNEGYLSDITDVGAGFYRSLALMSDGYVYAWGAGGHGQLGVNSDNNHVTAVQVHGLDYVWPSVVDQSQTAHNRFNLFGDGQRMGQTPTAGLYGILDRVGLCLATSAVSPAIGPVHVSIQTLTNTGLPSGTEIGSGTISLDIIPPAGDCAWVDASISGATLTAGTPYASVLSTSWPGDVVWNGILDGYPGERSFFMGRDLMGYGI